MLSGSSFYVFWCICCPEVQNIRAMLVIQTVNFTCKFIPENIVDTEIGQSRTCTKFISVVSRYHDLIWWAQMTYSAENEQSRSELPRVALIEIAVCYYFNAFITLIEICCWDQLLFQQHRKWWRTVVWRC